MRINDVVTDGNGLQFGMPADISEMDAQSTALASENVQKFLAGKSPRKVISCHGDWRILWCEPVKPINATLPIHTHVTLSRDEFVWYHQANLYTILLEYIYPGFKQFWSFRIKDTSSEPIPSTKKENDICWIKSSNKSN